MKLRIKSCTLEVCNLLLTIVLPFAHNFCYLNRTDMSVYGERTDGNVDWGSVHAQLILSYKKTSGRIYCFQITEPLNMMLLNWQMLTFSSCFKKINKSSEPLNKFTFHDKHWLHISLSKYYQYSQNGNTKLKHKTVQLSVAYFVQFI